MKRLGTIKRLAEKITIARLRRAASAEGLRPLPSALATTAIEALRALRPAICQRAGERGAAAVSSSAWAQLEGELDNAVRNEGLVLERVRDAWLPSLPDEALRGNAWGWLCSLPYGEVARVCEQWMSLRAHPSHPMARMRVWCALFAEGSTEPDRSVHEPLSPRQLARWSPEWRPTVDVLLLALRTSHAAVVEGARARALGGARGYVRAHFPAQFGAWEAALRADGLEPAEYTPLPTHPANVRLLRSRQAAAIEQGVLALLPTGEEGEGARVGTTIASTPMASLRTLLPLGAAHNGSALSPPCIKLCMPVQLTSLPRYLSPVEASEGPALSELISALVESTPAVRSALAIVPEDLSVYMWDGDLAAHQHSLRAVRRAARTRVRGAASADGASVEEVAQDAAEAARAAKTARVAGCSYEDARFVSALFRAPPQSLLRPAAAAAEAAARAGDSGGGEADERVLHVPLGALLAAPAVHCFQDGSNAEALGGRPLLAELALRHPAGVRAYGRAYAALVLRASLGLFARFGVALELHQQNSLLELRASDGAPLRLLCREVGGGTYIDEAAFGASVSPRVRAALHARQDAIVDGSLAWSSLYHSTVAMHLLPVGEALTATACAARPASARALCVAEMVGELRVAAGAVLDEVDAELAGLPPGPDSDARRAHARSVRARLLHAEQAPRKGLLLMRLLGTKAEKFQLGPNPLGRSRAHPASDAADNVDNVADDSAGDRAATADGGLMTV